MKFFYRFLTYYTERTEWNFMSRASIHFTDSTHLCVKGSHHLQQVNNSFEKERARAEIFIWKTIPTANWNKRVTLEKEAKPCGSRVTRSNAHPTPMLSPWPLFLLSTPQEHQFTEVTLPKLWLSHACPQGWAWWKCNLGPLLTVTSSQAFPRLRKTHASFSSPQLQTHQPVCVRSPVASTRWALGGTGEHYPVSTLSQASRCAQHRPAAPRQPLQQSQLDTRQLSRVSHRRPAHAFSQFAVQGQLRTGMYQQGGSREAEEINYFPLLSPCKTAWSTTASFGLPDTRTTLTNWSQATANTKVVQGPEHIADKKGWENCVYSFTKEDWGDPIAVLNGRV